jgi:hypothetical protein
MGLAATARRPIESMRGPGGAGPTRRRLRNALIVVAALFAVGIVLLFAWWPFSRNAVLKQVAESAGATVDVRKFRATYFPPGCVLEDVALRRQAGAGLPTLITATRLTIQTTVGALLHGDGTDARAAGLHVVVPPGSHLLSSTGSRQGTLKSRVRRFVADDAEVDFTSAKPGAEPLRFMIHHLSVTTSNPNAPLSFQVSLTNPEPPGEITSSGRIGPWNQADPKKTPVEGSYRFDHAQLGAFSGVSGTLSSQGTYRGELDRISVDDAADVPDFVAADSGHRIHLRTTFHAVVDGTNGDTLLEPVTGRFERSALVFRGGVRGSHGKTAALGVDGEGRIQDMLLMLTSGTPAAMTGAIRLNGRATLPPGKGDFYSRFGFQGDFEIRDVRLTNPGTQSKIDQLSARAQGKKNPKDVEDVSGDLTGHLELRRGIVTFSKTSLQVPGARAKVAGTYSLLNYRIDLHGTLATEATLSQSNSGLKSALLKPLNPLFKRKRAGAVVGISIQGTYDQPTFGIDLAH